MPYFKTISSNTPNDTELLFTLKIFGLQNEH